MPHPSDGKIFRRPKFPVTRTTKLLRYALPYRNGWMLIALLMFAAAALSLAQPWPMKFLIDRVLPPHDGSAPAGLVVWIALSGLAIFAINAIIESVLTRAWVSVGQKMVYDLAAELFSRLQRQSLQFHRQNTVGDAMSRITSDSWCVYKLVDTCLLTPARCLLVLITTVAVMLPMDWTLTLAIVATAPVMALVNLSLGKQTRDAARASREIESQIQAHVHQTLVGIQVVQAFSREQHEQDRFHHFTGLAVKAQRRGVWLGNLSDLGAGAVVTLGTGVVLWIGAREVLAKNITVGELLVFLAYLSAVYDQMKAMIGAHRTLQSLAGQIDRVAEVLETRPEVTEAPDAIALGSVRGEVALEHVSFGYEPGRPVLLDVSLHARTGQTIAIVGPTGAGKSTFASLIPRFADPWSGRVTLDGHDLRHLSLKSLRQNISVVLQEPFLFPASIAQNIAYGRPGAARPQIEAAARAASAHDFIARLPEGYDTVLGERGITLSGGERQRLSIARALLVDAPVLILDEPTSAIDAETEAVLLDALGRLMRGRTTFIIAHRLSTIRSADHIVVLEHGRITEAGTHDELLVAGGLYAGMWGLGAAGTNKLVVNSER